MSFEEKLGYINITLKEFICILWIQFAMAGNTNLEMKLLKK